MKKIFAIAIFSLLTLGLAAQVNSPVQQWLGAVHGKLGDTITNTGTAYDSIVLNLNYSSAQIEVQVTKISGTLGGQLTIQGANKPLTTTSTAVWTTLNDSITVSNTSGEKSYYFGLPTWALPKNGKTGLTQPTPLTLPYYCYRILWTGTGTMSGSMKTYGCMRVKQ